MKSFQFSCTQDIECRNLIFLETKRKLMEELEKQEKEKKAIMASKQESDGSLVLYLLTRKWLG